MKVTIHVVVESEDKSTRQTWECSEDQAEGVTTGLSIITREESRKHEAKVTRDQASGLLIIES